MGFPTRDGDDFRDRSAFRRPQLLDHEGLFGSLARLARVWACRAQRLALYLFWGVGGGDRFLADGGRLCRFVWLHSQRGNTGCSQNQSDTMAKASLSPNGVASICIDFFDQAFADEACHNLFRSTSFEAFRQGQYAMIVALKRCRQNDELSV